MLEEGSVKKAARHVSQGAGVRAQSGERTGYAHTDDLALPNLEEAARQARAIADRVVDLGGGGGGRRRPAPRPLHAGRASHRRRARTARSSCWAGWTRRPARLDPRVRQVIATLGSEDVVVMIATPSGWTVGDVRPLTRLNVTVIVEDGAKREIGSYGGGGRVAFDFFLEQDRWKHFAGEAVRQALMKLDAVDAPAGEMTVVLGPGWPGILLHEAVGHGLEGDFNRKKTSRLLGTARPDGGLGARDGGRRRHDRRTAAARSTWTTRACPPRRNVLIENGILRGYLQDRLNARLMGMEATGNGRRESYAHPPMPRMTNTFMLAGEDEPDDIIRRVSNAGSTR